MNSDKALPLSMTIMEIHFSLGVASEMSEILPYTSRIFSKSSSYKLQNRRWPWKDLRIVFSTHPRSSLITIVINTLSVKVGGVVFHVRMSGSLSYPDPTPGLGESDGISWSPSLLDDLSSSGYPRSSFIFFWSISFMSEVGPAT